MNERQIVRHVRTMLEHALPDAPEYTVRLWFCRLCALCCLMENQLLPPAHDEAAMLSRMTDARHFFPGIRLFHDDLPSPSCLLPSMQFLRQLPPSAWRGHPELPGWLYQYYNMPEREAVTDRIHRSRKVSAAHLPAATQLFTPDWIVRYMVQNALGTLLSPLPDWQYYLPPAQSQPVCKTPDAITVLDPCMGTGHILAYVFDALMTQFLSIGWHPETAAVHILTRSLCGMDIDRGAVLTAEFVLYMKAAAIRTDRPPCLAVRLTAAAAALRGWHRAQAHRGTFRPLRCRHHQPALSRQQRDGSPAFGICPHTVSRRKS